LIRQTQLPGKIPSGVGRTRQARPPHVLGIVSQLERGRTLAHVPYRRGGGGPAGTLTSSPAKCRYISAQTHLRSNNISGREAATLGRDHRDPASPWLPGIPGIVRHIFLPGVNDGSIFVGHRFFFGGPQHGTAENHGIDQQESQFSPWADGQDHGRPLPNPAKHGSFFAIELRIRQSWMAGRNREVGEKRDRGGQCQGGIGQRSFRTQEDFALLHTPWSVPPRSDL